MVSNYLNQYIFYFELFLIVILYRTCFLLLLIFRNIELLIYKSNSGFNFQKQNRAVCEAIIRLFDDKLLYQKYSLVNWCCSLQSTVSDIEINHEEIVSRTFINVPGNNYPTEFGVLTDIAYKFHNSGQQVPIYNLYLHINIILK